MKIYFMQYCEIYVWQVILVLSWNVAAFIERWHSEAPSFHLLHGEMYITLENVSFLLHLSIRGRLFDHSMITGVDALEMMVEYLRYVSYDALKEIEDTYWCLARFGFLERMYALRMTVVEQTDGDDEKAMQHRAYALRTYLLYLVDTSIFVDKSAYYVDVAYHQYFSNLERIHEYN